jgi:hypothetical protein
MRINIHCQNVRKKSVGRSFPEFYDEAVSLEFIIDRMLTGGWPALLNENVKNALIMNSLHSIHTSVPRHHYENRPNDICVIPLWPWLFWA